VGNRCDQAIEPKASNGHRFILVVIDYFTKWVEAASYSNVTRSVVVRFIKREIVCWYGLPRKIITDNATNLNNKMMKEMGEDFNIQHHDSTPYRPKMNGAFQKENHHYRVLNGQFTTLFGVISFCSLITSKLFCSFKKKNIPAIILGRHVKNSKMRSINSFQ